MYRKLLIILILPIAFTACQSGEIDREALVYRHFPGLTEVDTLSSFTLGNGNFAFTADVTGLQTFREEYENGIPLGTQSNWGWHIIGDTNRYSLADAFNTYDTHGRDVTYASGRYEGAGQWLRANPHRLHLGQIGFLFRGTSDGQVDLDEIKSIDQTLNLWQGILESNFSIDGNGVWVETASHSTLDQIAVRMQSPLFTDGKNGILFRFPYGTQSWGKQTGDWQSPGEHSSIIQTQTDRSVTIKRALDGVTYYVHIQWEGDAKFVEQAPHTFHLLPSGNEKFAFIASFSESKKEADLPGVGETFQDSKTSWARYWNSGGAIDLSESTDPRAQELERRIVLSQYLTAAQGAGDLPPQETGLTCNSWYGKFHLEMHWWHGVHHILWGRTDLFKRSLPFYDNALANAQKKAERQGYKGARWPKMVGPDGRESPSDVGVFLIWQQPHPIYFAELLYREAPTAETLERMKTLVFETAEFMASYAHWVPEEERYVLGPPLIPAQEIYDKEQTMNPPFELSYWQYGLQVAQRWRERMGMDRVEKWDHVITHLSDLPQQNELYQNAETAMGTFEDEFHRNDHPTLLGAYGMLPNDSVDVETMRRTLNKVMETWNWEETWGWDYPLTAMTAARVGEPEMAINALLMDVQKNTYLNNGHNYQDDRLTLYLPGNGGLLTAVAMMAAGWDSAPNEHAPGFPDEGWTVKYEGLSQMP
ncbi:MAG: hypothetical protein K9N46_02145 [Candidatus Marinimicrobia bacterium]|nr:hypothetical protein [Candidatus Neomarinimicrobiota bacterium]MCF7828301.1 hypothetical protein [Candidatus Neomarinimicrobiota bacterium]MCF7879524.1 hypothetical protein [Candidatus Neomarinimicrobiota bacterium]